MTKPFELKITKTITNDQIACLLCVAFEGGMTSYWSKLVKVKKPSAAVEFKGDWGDYKLYSYPLGTGGQAVIEDTETGKKHILNRKAIQKGLEVMANKYPKHFNDFITERDDAITGDVFVQCCLLGDVLYG